jgi:hypothetical protein
MKLPLKLPDEPIVQDCEVTGEPEGPDPVIEQVVPYPVPNHPLTLTVVPDPPEIGEEVIPKFCTVKAADAESPLLPVSVIV